MGLKPTRTRIQTRNGVKTDPDENPDKQTGFKSALTTQLRHDGGLGSSFVRVTLPGTNYMRVYVLSFEI